METEAVEGSEVQQCVAGNPGDIEIVEKTGKSQISYN